MSTPSYLSSSQHKTLGNACLEKRREYNEVYCPERMSCRRHAKTEQQHTSWNVLLGQNEKATETQEYTCQVAFGNSSQQETLMFDMSTNTAYT